jgi:hypothetical protein
METSMAGHKRVRGQVLGAAGETVAPWRPPCGLVFQGDAALTDEESTLGLLWSMGLEDRSRKGREAVLRPFAVGLDPGSTNAAQVTLWVG